MRQILDHCWLVIVSSSLNALLAKRRQHYASFAEQIDTTSKTPQQVAWQVQINLGRYRVRGMGGGYDVSATQLQPGTGGNAPQAARVNRKSSSR